MSLLSDAPDVLQCPLCPHAEPVTDNGDTAAVGMVGHFLDEHHHELVNDLLARVTQVPGGAR